MDKRQLYRLLPKVDTFLMTEAGRRLTEQYGRERVASALREELGRLRAAIGAEEPHEEGSEDDAAKLKNQISGLKGAVEKRLSVEDKPHFQKVINATGVLLHTNLGRAPIAGHAAGRLAELLQGYTNLEYNLESGMRGERYEHFEQLLCRLTGAEAAMAVNNNAAAVMLMLSTFAKGKEVILSRGEMIEIGGKFRIPEVMEASGCRLKEIGTTNKTHLSDYENAVGPDTGAILKVHTSNYRVLGFTASVKAGELEPLKRKYKLPLLEDLGSGVLVNLEEFGLEHEPTVQESLAAGADVVCFSGDKLLGGPQAGILVGKKGLIGQMKKNPLTRAIRIDKCTACLLEEALCSYVRDAWKAEIPIYRYLSRSIQELERLAGLFGQYLETSAGAEGSLLSWKTIRETAPMGGGSLPLEEIETRAAAVSAAGISPDAVIKALHTAKIPVIARIAEDELIFDMRCMEEADLQTAAEEVWDCIRAERKKQCSI